MAPTPTLFDCGTARRFSFVQPRQKRLHVCSCRIPPSHFPSLAKEIWRVWPSIQLTQDAVGGVNITHPHTHTRVNFISILEYSFYSLEYICNFKASRVIVAMQRTSNSEESLEFVFTIFVSLHFPFFPDVHSF